MNTNFLPSGHLLHQRYSIQQSLGQGGFGMTYLAYDTMLDQEVCIKELFIAGNSTRGTNLTVLSQSIQGFSFEGFVNRFMEEARKLAQFRHPNIVRVLEWFQANATAYMVMDYVKGETLKQKVQKEGALSEQMAMKLIEQLLNGVEEVHKKGMLHRDIKPDNILVTPEGQVVLIDFGSAREFSNGMTTTHTAMLTPGYAPIEQYSDRAQRGPFTDIYALGATTYFMLTGDKPIPVTDRNLEELISPNSLKSNISSHLSSAVMLSMEMKPEHRFQSVSEMREVLKYKGDSGNNKSKDLVFTQKREPEKKILKEGKPKSRDGLYILIAIVMLLLFVYLNLFNSTAHYSQYEELTENESENQYHRIKIGNQEWMTSNLSVEKFRNGDLIPEAKTEEEWKRAGENREPAWSHYGNNRFNIIKYGKLYNWYALIDPRGLAPKGWHIPSNEEWEKLISFYGGWDKAGGKLKSSFDWEENGNGTNGSGFSGMPGGFRSSGGKFVAIGEFGSWWNSTETNAGNAWYRYLNKVGDDVGREYTNKGAGLSIRCLKD
jgi:uncharacterized protein (TIGR02145 family)